MSKHYQTGVDGEQLACEHLIAKGYAIKEVNWRYAHKEIDIVAQKDNVMVFVEVKTRSNTAFELPQEAVTIAKQKNLVFAADAYLISNEIDLESRFDVVTVLATEPMKILEHIEGAFEPNEL